MSLRRDARGSCIRADLLSTCRCSTVNCVGACGASIPELSTKAEDGFDENDKREDSDHGDAYSGDGLEDRAVLRRAKHV